jgi:AraC family transcriptional regulator
LNYPEASFRTYPKTILVGISRRMSFADNKTPELWRMFMPRLKEIKHRASNELLSLQVYKPNFDFSPHAGFVKWALTPVYSTKLLPEGMETFTIPEEIYAVFNYRGKPGDPGIFHYIFSDWLPRSGYKLDSRPHFEILGELYDPFSDESEEEIWIPVGKQEK